MPYLSGINYHKLTLPLRGTVPSSTDKCLLGVHIQRNFSWRIGIILPNCFIGL